MKHFFLVGPDIGIPKIFAFYPPKKFIYFLVLSFHALFLDIKKHIHIFFHQLGQAEGCKRFKTLAVQIKKCFYKVGVFIFGKPGTEL
jgi:hypothetical protein